MLSCLKTCILRQKESGHENKETIRKATDLSCGMFLFISV